MSFPAQVLPDSTSKLTRLKTLRLDHNNFSVLPPGLLEGCTALQTLSLHGNTCDVEVRGWPVVIEMYTHPSYSG